MACKKLKFKNVLVIDVDKNKINIAKKLGYKKNIALKNIKNIKSKIIKFTKGKYFDYTIESSGRSQSIEFAFSITRKFGGNCIFASHPRKNSRIKLKPHDLISGKTILGSWGGSSDPQKIANYMAPFFLKNKKFLDLYFSKEYPLNNINRAINDFKYKSSIKLIINN